MKKLPTTLLCTILVSFIVLLGCRKYKKPVVETLELTDITQYSAKCGGNITDDRGQLILHRGICWSTLPEPTAMDGFTDEGSGQGYFYSDINYLEANTTYYLRAYAKTSAGTGYGSTVTFTTPVDVPIFNPNLSYGTLTDIDGNVYKTIKIGSQTWMAENLKTTHYRNGDPIPNIVDDQAWNATTSGAYCYYQNSSKYNNAFGKLYNAYTVTDVRNIAPPGWHVPSLAEWTTMINIYGGIYNAGCKLKEAGSIHWASPYNSSTNESGLTAIGAGYRAYDSKFNNFRIEGFWWTSTEYNSLYADEVQMSDEWSGSTISANDKRLGYSIRCIKD